MAKTSGKFKGELSRRRSGRLRAGYTFTFSMDKFKSYFFRPSDWIDILEPAEYVLLDKIAMDLREQGRRLIRKRKRPSRKGSSPSSWEPHKLKKTIYSGVDYADLAAFAGPIKFSGMKSSKPLSQPTIPAILQFGGKIWHAYPSFYDPPRVRTDLLPARRVVRIAPRPYMDKAYKQKEKKILRMTENMIGKSPAAVMIAKNKARTRAGSVPI